MWRDRSSEIDARPRVALLVWASIALLIGWWHLFAHGTNIGSAELWLDESSTWGVAHRSLGRVFTLPTEFHSQPPLYYLILHFWMKLSDARWFMRGFSWLCCLGLLQYVLWCVDELNLFARVTFCVLFMTAALPGYLSTALRPYGLAALSSFVATILFLRLVREPSKRRASEYAVAALVMAYTMAFDVWVLVSHGVVFVAALAFFAIREKRAVLRRQLPTIAALAGVALGYLPYLAMAIHWQYRKNASANLDYATQLGHHRYIANEFFAYGAPAMVALALLMVVGVVGELRERRALSLVWLVIALGQVSFVVWFMYGRNEIGPTGRYMTPAFVSACMLAALGAQQIAPRSTPALWVVTVIWLAYVVQPQAAGFRAYVKDPQPDGTWSRMRDDLLARSHTAGVFFDMGYGGQDFEYVIRNDPSIVTFTQRGPLLASGGNDHLDDDYVRSTIEKTHDRIECYYYVVAAKDGPYGRVFQPEMTRLGYAHTLHAGPAEAYCLARDP